MTEDPPADYTEGIAVWLTRNGLWVAARRPDGHGIDREFIPGMALRLLAAKRLAFTTRTEREKG
jgi:hypothetical protein